MNMKRSRSTHDVLHTAILLAPMADTFPILSHVVPVACRNSWTHSRFPLVLAGRSSPTIFANPWAQLKGSGCWWPSRTKKTGSA